jgi:xylulokinase
MFAVGIDSGTQGTKALIVELHSGKVIGRGYAAHAMVQNLKPGASEQHPHIWVQAMEKALAAALKKAKIRPEKIVSLGISGQQHGFVALDREGIPVRPAKLWNDTSTVEETEFIVDSLGGKKTFIRRVGISLAVGYTASKILWLKRKESKRFRRLATVLLPHSPLRPEFSSAFAVKILTGGTLPGPSWKERSST